MNMSVLTIKNPISFEHAFDCLVILVSALVSIIAIITNNKSAKAQNSVSTLTTKNTISLLTKKKI